MSYSFLGYGQEAIKAKHIREWQPLYYLDSINVEMSQLHFDPNKIADIKVVGNFYDSSRQIHGKIFMKSKDPKNFNFLTIADIKSAYKKDTQMPVIYMLNNEFLKDIINFKIDSSYILKVEITSTTTIDYLKNSIPDLMILKIITRTKEITDKQNQIRIQGTELTAMK